MRASWLFLATTLAACPKAPATDNDKAPPPGTAGKMYRHWDLGTKALTSVISGDLESVRSYGSALANLPGSSTVPSEFQAYDTAMRTSAKAVGAASDLKTAAEGVAALGVSCANCHTAWGKGPKVDPYPMQSWGEEDHMVRHYWAAHWMWLGVVTPSAESWTTGASGIQEVELILSEEVEPLEARIHELIAASSTPSPDILAEVLFTCGSCHTKYGVVPRFAGDNNPLDGD